MEKWNEELAPILLEELPIGIVYYAPLFKPGSPGKIEDFTLVYCNRIAAVQIDSSGDSLFNRRISSFDKMDDQVKKDLHNQLLHVYTSGETIRTEYFNRIVGRYFHVTRSKIAKGILTTAKDITDSVILKKEKEQHEELSTRILNNSLHGWFYCEAVRDENNNITDFRFVTINPEFTRIIRREPDDVIGKTHLTLFPAARTNGIHDLNCRVVDNKVVERKIMYYHGDDMNAWYDVVASPLGEDGLLVTFADITQTKEKELEAANLANTLKTVIDTAQVGIFTFTPVYDAKGKIADFRFTMVNPALSSYVAQEPETLLGAQGSEWFPGYLHNGVFDMYRETYLTGKSQREQFHYNVDGIDVYLDIQSTRIGDELLVTFSDFTPLQLAQFELQKSIRELQRSNQNLEEFTRAASHDLKEPIRKIQVFSDRLKQTLGPVLTDTSRDLFSRMEHAATRMRMLIDDLLDYSHVDSQVQMNESVDLNEVLRIVTSDLEVMIDETGAVIEYEHLPEIRGNRRQIQQLFLNLVNNSIKYRKPTMNPHVFIHSTEVTGASSELHLPDGDLDTNYHKIEVSDNGIGFDQHDSERIFKVFTRLHSTRDYIGTGIGLAIANKVMANHAGYIFARAVKGQGSTFTLLFPAQSVTSSYV